jgi:hypothetical protein
VTTPINDRAGIVGPYIFHSCYLRQFYAGLIYQTILTLLDAKSVAYVDPASGGTSGIFLAQTLERLGIASELKSKTRLV